MCVSRCGAFSYCARFRLCKQFICVRLCLCVIIRLRVFVHALVCVHLFVYVCESIEYSWAYIYKYIGGCASYLWTPNRSTLLLLLSILVVVLLLFYCWQPGRLLALLTRFSLTSQWYLLKSLSGAPLNCLNGFPLPVSLLLFFCLCTHCYVMHWSAFDAAEAMCVCIYICMYVHLTRRNFLCRLDKCRAEIHHVTSRKYKKAKNERRILEICE